jgi:hypothetical protein
MTPEIIRALTVRAPRVDDGVMAHTKSHRKLVSEMREAQLKKEQREAPLRARLKVELCLRSPRWVNGDGAIPNEIDASSSSAFELP